MIGLCHKCYASGREVELDEETGLCHCKYGCHQRIQVDDTIHSDDWHAALKKVREEGFDFE